MLEIMKRPETHMEFEDNMEFEGNVVFEGNMGLEKIWISRGIWSLTEI